MTSLLCDLGGTNCRFVLAESGSPLRSEDVVSLRNDNFSNFDTAVLSFLEMKGSPQIERFVVALAAPVDREEIQLTNRDWTLSRKKLVQILSGTDVHFINDLEALALGLSKGDVSDHQPVRKGTSQENSVRLVVSSGTGFNSAAQTPDGCSISSETGHATFAVETELDFQIQKSIAERFGRCSMDRVISGSGLIETYAAVCKELQTSGGLPSSEAIISAAMEKGDEVALRACNEFCRILGRATGDLAMYFLPFGGIWLAGGMVHAIKPLLLEPEGEFNKAFLTRGRMTDVVSDIPIYVLDDGLPALEGCQHWLQLHSGNAQTSPAH